MPAIYKESGGEIRVYRNRMPQANGGNPQMIKPILLGLLYGFLLFTNTLLLFFGPPDYRIPYLFIVVFIFVYLLYHTLNQFQCTVFAPKKKIVYQCLFFVKWNVIPFKNIVDVTPSDQENEGKRRFFYILRLAEEFAEGVRISPRAKTMLHLEGYARDLVPKLRALPGLVKESVPDPEPESGAEADEPAEVAVDEVEVPMDYAETVLARQESMAARAAETPPDAGAPGDGAEAPEARETPVAKPGKTKKAAAGNQAGKGKKGKKEAKAKPLFVQKGAVYSRSNKGEILLALVVGLIMVNASGYYFIHLGWGVISPVIWNGGLMAFCSGSLIYQLAGKNTDFHIDVKKREVFFHVMFGFRMLRFPYSRIKSFTTKTVLGTRTLNLELENQRVDPLIMESRSPEEVKKAYEETCAIMGLDPKKYWKQ